MKNTLRVLSFESSSVVILVIAALLLLVGYFAEGLWAVVP